MKKNINLYLSLAVIAVLSGCATAYQPKGATGGYSSSQLAENIFQIMFKGNGYTNREKANDFALLRSAELTLEKGYQYFVIVDGQQYTKNSSFTTPITATTNITSNTYGSAYGYGNTTNYYGNTYGSATTTVSGGQTFHISKPTASNTIVCFKEKPEGFFFNAEFVVKSLRGKYDLEVPNK